LRIRELVRRYGELESQLGDIENNRVRKEILRIRELVRRY